ncbi:hypothetical protein AXG93_115s1720 [Marchantia polymorpha subsp. ruderalis]|uniref:Uncharacterized protein n=1 Tax=Marchantia polymorpha subsp. ruderalis TaxID=1480154 RepID=A0A176W786_MARPO|nr:hypothetical protein AXG93_115s1720 [Marchantia polymorpha subsp. ruderalis]
MQRDHTLTVDSILDVRQRSQVMRVADQSSMEVMNRVDEASDDVTHVWMVEAMAGDDKGDVCHPLTAVVSTPLVNALATGMVKAMAGDDKGDVCHPLSYWDVTKMHARVVAYAI